MSCVTTEEGHGVLAGRSAHLRIVAVGLEPLPELLRITNIAQIEKSHLHKVNKTSAPSERSDNASMPAGTLTALMYTES